ncbi:hypothetical protein U9M48_021800 [Paspalum notatum var. saurae]|uniref:Glutaredoxin-like protein n=1 Tax=Paspalum notatum var. saurae TaxID=547442 RepID=A0AAQ3TIA0_PASNO
MAAAVSALPRTASRLALRGRQPPFRALCAAAAAGDEASKRRLVLYTKPGCCLCDGLKEKLHAASLLAGTPYSLASLELQASQFASPYPLLLCYNLLVRSEMDGWTEILPRLSPRLSVELVQKKIYAALDQ